MALAVLTPFPSLAQGDFPAAVIEECNAAGDASDLPDCLKSGALAFEMLAAAKSDEFYSHEATPVIEDCARRNDALSGVWICFEKAAEAAAETRQLIGISKIADACVAGISDPDTFARLEELHRMERDARFPNAMFFGGGTYHPFRECPKQETRIDPTINSGLAPLDDAEDPDILFDIEACSAYREMERVISVNSPDSLRALKVQLDGLADKKDYGRIAIITGISENNIAHILSEDNDRAETTVALLGSFIRRYHPALIEEALSASDAAKGDAAFEAGKQMGEAFIHAMLDQADERYRVACRAR